MADNYYFFSAGDETRFRILHAITSPIDKLTVGEICERCSISRPTFYKHFSSKYAISDWFLDLAFDLYLAQIGITFDWERGVSNFFSFIYNERDCLKNLFVDSPSRQQVENQLSARRQAVTTTIEQITNAKPDDDLQYYIEYFVNMGNLITVVWCQELDRRTPEKMARYFTECMPETLIDVLNSGINSSPAMFKP